MAEGGETGWAPIPVAPRASAQANVFPPDFREWRSYLREMIVTEPEQQTA